MGSLNTQAMMIYTNLQVKFGGLTDIQVSNEELELNDQLVAYPETGYMLF